MTENNLTEYNWWGNDNAPPDNLKTTKQCNELGLKPVNPRGIIHTKKYDILLYDITDNDSVIKKKPLSDKQLKSLELRKLKKDYEYYLIEHGRDIKTKIRHLKLSQKILNNPSDYLILSVKTFSHQILELCFVNVSGQTVYNQHYYPHYLNNNEYWKLRLDQENLIKWGDDTNIINKILENKKLIVIKGLGLIPLFEINNNRNKLEIKKRLRLSFVDFDLNVSSLYSCEGYADQLALELLKLIKINIGQKINFPLKYKELALKDIWFRDNQDLFLFN